MIDRLHEPMHAGDLIVAALAHDLDRPVLCLADGEIMTAGQMRDAASRYVQLFARLGIGAGSRVALLSKNRPEVIELLVAMRVAGCTGISLHPMGAPEEWAYVMEDAGVETLIFDPAFNGQLATLRADPSPARTWLALGPSELAPDMIAQAASIAPAPLVATPVSSDDLVIIGYTGGTTGKPKGIPVPHRVADLSTAIQLSEWDWPRPLRHLVCSPLSHAGGTALIPVLVRGGTLYVSPGPDPVSILSAIEKHRITSTMMVPTMVINLIDHPRLRDFDLSSLQTLYYGASSFPAARLRDALERLGPVLFQFYGQGEAPMSITLMRREEHLIDDAVRLASCGRPTPWVRIALLDDAGREVGDEEPGEICVQGPLVMPGYLNRPDATAEALAGGWLHTGDVAIRSADGFLRIVDRKKDMIVTGGFNVFAREVEDALAEHPAVAAVAVFGLPDPKWGEQVTAAVVRAAGAQVDEAELIAHVRARKGSVQAPKQVFFVDALPLSPVGKPDKRALKLRFGAPAAG